ncbi:hypothetical protein EW145_g7694 [Phellinidium pouzarii]|uniref:Transglycosylase SLT domain-containing protein n=1 Tax=Phellinidium pouzarii TaxID=167371 RepID=A0A4S4KFQ5_9AGAM|nr:hypothetical protein EW145_g7694 [Phellinidium pouzarii]
MNPLRTLAALVLGSLLILNVQASFHDKASPNHLDAHRRLIHRVVPSAPSTGIVISGRSGQRCKQRESSSVATLTSSSTTWSSSSAYSPPPTSTWSSSSSYTPPPTSTRSSSLSWPSSKPQQTPASNANVFAANVATGLINVVSNCGDIGATKDITAVSGPNGDIDWLNCGINSDGWNPPDVKVSDLITVDLSWAVQQPGTPFSACSAYISKFEQYGGQFGIGGAGEQGLMQLTKDKCGNAPGGNCQDIDYNISTGASYFASSLSSNNGNVLLTIGEYNGWGKGLTFGAATAAASTSCCRCQNNLD